ncbi:MAG: TonB-dependent receptor [Acidobacteria bacterium]|nr:TonB-dependent receptor [Acidobacteriota bacterium]
MKRCLFSVVFVCLLCLVVSLPARAQTITATLEGRVLDPAGALIPGASVTAVNDATGLSRSATTSEVGDYRLLALPVGTYTVSAEKEGFRREVQKVTLLIGQTATLDFTLQVGERAEEVVVEARGALLEPTRTTVASVIAEKQIESLPVSGRQFIDFALLAPGVNIGETTSGSTDVIVEPVTKLSFGGQNIHFNFVAIDGADNMSTASGIQKTTPSQEAVREFQVINSTYSTEFGRGVGGIVNIVTKSGTNEFHGSLYEFFQNDALNARSILSRPGLTKLQQNQFGVTLGGPIAKDKTFIFGNYEGQRRHESPFYNSALFDGITIVNATKTAVGLRPEELNVTRTANSDNLLVRIDHAASERHLLSGRYFFNDGRFTRQSPLNDGFDAPSTFRNNFFRDQSLVVNLTSTFSPTFLNEYRWQWARRTFDFPATSGEPHLEIANTFTTGVNRGNPDFYRETRVELVDKVTLIRGPHTVSFGGNFNFVRTIESFPLFYPFEATFACLTGCLFSYDTGTPFVIFFQRNDAASNFTEPTILPNGTGVFAEPGIPDSIRDLAKGALSHTYNGFFIQDKWRATPNLTLNFGVRYEWETWPSRALDDDLNNVDPRFGFAYNLGTEANFVLRGGIGLFHGTIPSPLLACQIPSCGGVLGQYPGREEKEDELDATTRLFAFAADPFTTQIALNELLTNARYPDAVPTMTCPLGFPSANGTLAGCGFFADAVIVRFARDHQAPYAIQMTLGLEFEPVPDLIVNLSYLRVKGIHLGSFWNVNVPPPTGQDLVHDSRGNVGLKNTYFCPVIICGAPGIPGVNNPNFAVYFEADSLWRSVFDGLLINVNRRFRRHLGFGISYTWSKTIDDGPNPSFVLIPQDSPNFDPDLRAERALSSDHAAHRFVGNATIAGPTDRHPLVNDFQFSTIVTLRSTHFFTKFAGFDANGDVFGVNDRVGLEPRNTFKGDGLYSLDFRLSRMFHLGERADLEFIGEMFNAFNILNIRFFNTVYGAADFCNVPAPLHPTCGAGPFFLEGSPNPAYGTPRAINPPRHFQFALRLTF